MLGVLEFDGYYTSDISAYESEAGYPAVPLQTVLLDGYNGVPTRGPNSGNPEVSLDIEMAIAMALWAAAWTCSWRAGLKMLPLAGPPAQERRQVLSLSPVGKTGRLLGLRIHPIFKPQLTHYPGYPGPRARNPVVNATRVG
jgi:hypothetical protein